MMRFIYKAVSATEDLPSPDQLDKFGEDGWELVQIIARGEELICYFKKVIHDA